MSKSAKGVYGPSPELTDALGIDNKVVVPGVLNEELVQSAKTRGEQSGGNSPLKLLYCGNLDESKGVDMMMEAVELIAHPLEIHICGKGPLAEKLEQMCQNSRHSAIFHGLVSAEELIKYQISADIAVNPHRKAWHSKGEVWPFKVVEYLAACGVVISSRTGRIEKGLEERLFIYEEDTPESLAHKIEEMIRNWKTISQKAPENRRWAIEKWGTEGVGQTMELLLEKAGAFKNAE